jgi:choline dehydrogenase
MRSIFRRSSSWLRTMSVLCLGILSSCDSAPPDSDAVARRQALDDDPTDAPETFEYIVIGSGAGGGPLAANLARARHSVLLLEAGDDVSSRLSYQVPAWHIQSTEDSTMRWDYFVKHYEDTTQARKDSKMEYEGTAQKGILYPRSGTLGGCTAHNAMITVYPHNSDWDRIASLTGDSSWSATNMRQYFQRVERNRYLTSATELRGHGTSGWLQTERADTTLGLLDAKILTTALSAAIIAGYDERNLLKALFGDLREILAIMNRDLNSAEPGRDTLEGAGSIPLATAAGRRNGTLEYLKQTVAAGYPLTLRTQALVTKVLFSSTPSGGKQVVTGVEYLAGGRLYRADPRAPRTGSGGAIKTVNASREVILSAGAFNTPQLLKLSGIGPAAELARFGIPVKVDLPGVGRNLQDRYEVGLVSEVDSDFSLLRDCKFADVPTDYCLDEWKRYGTGVYASNGGVIALTKRSTAGLANPDLFVFGLPGAFRGYYRGYSSAVLADKRHFTWAILKAHTKNKAGTVTLRSADPRDTPEISFKYFHEGDRASGEDAADLNAMVEGVLYARRIIAKADSLMLFGKFEETFPGPTVRTRDQIAQFVKNEAWGHHASCTAKIGATSDPLAVLDSKFRVRGTTNLRVVDASVFPEIPGFFIVTPIYMISEKASDVILADAR